MRALSVMQPWASLIVGGPLAPGVKRTENRGRAVATIARGLVGQRIAIHASKKLDEAAFHVLKTGGFGFRIMEWPYRTPREFPRGAIVGTATLDRVFGAGEPASVDELRFYTGDFGLSFGDRQHIEPIAIGGALGFWTLPAEVDVLVTERLAKPAPIAELIARSSVGQALADVKARGIDAHLADLDAERGKR